MWGITFYSGLGVLAAGLATLIFAFYRFRNASKAWAESSEALKSAKRTIDAERREMLLKIKDEIYKRRAEFELEIKRERLELNRLQSKMSEKYESLERREEQLEETRREVQHKERHLSKLHETARTNEEKMKRLYEDLVSKLERIGGMSRDEARNTLIDSIKLEAKASAQKWLQKLEEKTKEEAKSRSVNILINAMQRFMSDHVTPYSSGIVQLPSDDMKGRIIGKEGRNIKALEIATGMEFVIGDTPEIITISGFNPIRREIARRSLEKLVLDGRINPTRIEETVEQCEQEIDEIIREKGREAAAELDIQGLHSEIVMLLGKLHFRTSFSQNVLVHSREVALFSRMIAQELGLSGELATRAGLLHDIGKALSAEVEGPHAKVGADFAKQHGESHIVVNAIAAHHEEASFASPYAPIVLIADTISASRPGARRETLSAYLKRLESLEEIAYSFDGVKKAYALQAGREIRVIIEEDRLDDEKAQIVARDMAARIESEMSYPGQIKVNVIREKRSIEYAK